ncbi:hypothetical protein BVRB_1g021290 [Beta vulgaris subsp. vulgaris]|nr:hypothetical protein BVRB_1g021290 [Beta vulgaris subsp. vulgaris]
MNREEVLSSVKTTKANEEAAKGWFIAVEVVREGREIEYGRLFLSFDNNGGP